MYSAAYVTSCSQLCWHSSKDTEGSSKQSYTRKSKGIWLSSFQGKHSQHMHTPKTTQKLKTHFKVLQGTGLGGGGGGVCCCFCVAVCFFVFFGFVLVLLMLEQVLNNWPESISQRRLSELLGSSGCWVSIKNTLYSNIGWSFSKMAFWDLLKTCSTCSVILLNFSPLSASYLLLTNHFQIDYQSRSITWKVNAKK